MTDISGTRALKNARYIQQVAPHIIPAKEPLEGFASLVPFDILRNFHHLAPSAAALRDRPDLRALIESGKQPKIANFAEPAAAAGASELGVKKAFSFPFGEPLFRGTLHFVKMVFNTNTIGGGAKAQISLSTDDVNTIIQYAKLAVIPICAYCRQYGFSIPPSLPSLAVDNTILERSVNLATTQYTDDMLRVWVNDIVLENILPDKSTCLVILNPRGITNSDGDRAQNVGGYHHSDIVPYCFVNVNASGLTVADPGNRYANTLSHEIAEMVVDSTVHHLNPEVCDGCAGNCNNTFAWLNFFSGIDDSYLKTQKSNQPFPSPYTFFIGAIATKTHASDCPAPTTSCAYMPPFAFEEYPRFLANLTGDKGHTDIVGFGSRGVFVARGNGDGTFQPHGADPDLKSFGYSDDAGGRRVEKHPSFLADLRGHGVMDIVGFGDRGVWVALGDGNGKFHSAGTDPVLKSFG